MNILAAVSHICYDPIILKKAIMIILITVHEFSDVHD